MRKCEEGREMGRERLGDWESAVKHVESKHPDEIHCGCVPVLRKLLTEARAERDEAVEKAIRCRARLVEVEMVLDELRRADSPQ